MPRGALLIHGFTATPECMDSLKTPLEEAGFIVEVPLLPGHGTNVRELARTTWKDWYEGVLRAYRALQKKADAIGVAGQSLGGLLGLRLASEVLVKGLALLATPVLFTNLLTTKILPFVGGTPLRHVYPYQPKWLGPAINDPVGRKAFKSYGAMPVASLMEIIRLQSEVRDRLVHVTAPTLILHAVHDNTAPYASVAYLEEHLGAKTVRTITLEKSNHVLTMDYEKDLVAREIVEFFGRVLGGPK